MIRLRTAACLLSAAALIAGCAGDQGPSSGPDPVPTGEPNPAGVLQVMGTDTLQWEPPALEAPAGEIVFELQCGERVNHNLVVGDERTLVAECAPGDTAQGTLTLEPGEYPFVCTIPGHERSMQGTLTVG